MSETAPQLDLCPACGARSDSDVGCPRCGAGLLVDLWLEAPVPEPRIRFQAARELAALLPAASFSAIRASLARPGEPVATRLPRGAARRGLEALSRHGVRAVARASPASSGRSRWPRRAAFGTALLLALAAGLGALVWARARTAASAAGESSLGAGPSGAARRVPAEGAAPAERPLSTQELTALTLGSVVEVACGAQGGTAFFVTPERAVTNAHVACGQGEPLKVRFADGRQLLGRMVEQDRKLDLAVLEVVGAAARPLPVGDSTALAPGDPLVLLGSPQGLAFTAHEAKVSHPRRNAFGRALIQLNGSVNPGNSGGPLLDARGRVVGVVSMKVTNADGIGLALPVEYLFPFFPGLEPADAQARQRWAETLRQVRQEDAAEVERYRGRYVKPALGGGIVTPGGELYVVVLRRWQGAPSRLAVTVDLRSEGKVLCSSETAVDAWEPAQERLERELRDAPDQPRLRWAAEHGLLRDVYAGLGPLDLSGCAAGDLPATAVLAVRDGDESASPIQAPRPSQLEASVRQQQARERDRSVREAAQGARAEQEWRGAFRRARDEISALEVRRNDLLARVQDSLPTTAPDDPRRQLAGVEARLSKSREWLQDLERQASNAAVPREWRE